MRLRALQLFVSLPSLQFISIEMNVHGVVGEPEDKSGQGSSKFYFVGADSE